MAESVAEQRDDFLRELFGVDAAQIDSDPFAVLQAVAQDPGGAHARLQQDIERIRRAIEDRLSEAAAEHDNWAGRQYKRNTTQVEFRGDGPSRQASMSVGAINESRRNHAMLALAEEMGCMRKLLADMSDPTGAERVLANMRSLMGKARDAVESGNWRGYTVEAMFESILLDTLKVRGPAGRGSVTSNGLSRAVLAAITEIEHDAPSQEEASTPVTAERRERHRG
jgi:hypothetical protein